MCKDHKQKHGGADRVQIPAGTTEERDNVHNILMIFDTRKVEERPMGKDDTPYTESKLRVLSFSTGRSSIHQVS